VAEEDPLITLETDKATMDVPAPRGGKVVEGFVAVGDKLASGDLILTFEPAASESDAAPSQARPDQPAPPATPTAVAGQPGEFSGSPDARTGLLVLGAGPGGYTAAFRAADLGMEVTLVERWDALGGVCLNVGCIPSKALLHAARVIEEAADMSACGVTFQPPHIDAAGLRAWKDRVVGRLTGGLDGLARQRKVTVVHGDGSFLSPNHLQVRRGDEIQVIQFEQCIIAAGSESASLPGLPDDERIMDSTDALELAELPQTMLVIGGGIIGLEMATVYDALGVEVSIVELTDTLMPGCDRDLVRPLEKRLRKRYDSIMLSTKVVGIEAQPDGLKVSFDGSQAPDSPRLFGRVLVAVGRRANGGLIGADLAGVAADERGLITVDNQMRTNVSHIFAIGDIVGEPMLAHKATHEGKVAAEVAAGHKRAFDARVIPSVAYTDPEVAWVGLTETAAREQGLEVGKGVFPWAASGRALALNRDEGFTKLLFDKDTGRLVGAGIVGTAAGDLIAEAALAIEMGADAADIGLTIHPHPTLSETVGMAAEAFEGSLTDLYLPRR
jgi:dihydrolipoamide dehydrogenase